MGGRRTDGRVHAPQGSFIRRNGVQGSFRRTITEHIALDEPYLNWIVIVNHPDYLTEPLVRSVTFQRAPNVQLPVYPCAPQPEEYRADVPKDHVPNWFVGTNPYLTELNSGHLTGYVMTTTLPHERNLLETLDGLFLRDLFQRRLSA